jgi:hypothetical protein
MPTIISGDGTITGLTSTGISAVQALPSGTVKQVQFATVTNDVSTSSSSYVTLGLSKSITPSSTSSKIYAIAMVRVTSSASATAARLAIFRDSTNVTSSDGYTMYGSTMYIIQNLQVLDSPATTSAITYSVQLATSGSSVSMSSGMPATLILMEIA